MRQIVSLILVLSLLVLSTGASYPKDSVTIVLETDASLAKTDAVKAFLFDEEGNLLHTMTSEKLSFALPLSQIRNAKTDVSSNYALRVISNRAIGVLWFTDSEVLGHHTELTIKLQAIPEQAPNNTVKDEGTDLSLSEGFIVREATYDWGVHLTTVGEIHACSKMYTTVQFAAQSEVGVEVAKRWEGSSNWFGIGFAHKTISSSVYTTPRHENPSDSPTGGREMQREYAYVMEVWAQYDGNGELVTRWEELKVSHLVGSFDWGKAVDGDREDYGEVLAWQHGAREYYPGGGSLERSYNQSHTYDVGAKIFGTEIATYTAYESGTKVIYTMHTFDKPNESHSYYALYSKAGGISNPVWPRVLFTHN